MQWYATILLGSMNSACLLVKAIFIKLLLKAAGHSDFRSQQYLRNISALPRLARLRVRAHFIAGAYIFLPSRLKQTEKKKPLAYIEYVRSATWPHTFHINTFRPYKLTMKPYPRRFTFNIVIFRESFHPIYIII